MSKDKDATQKENSAEGGSASAQQQAEESGAQNQGNSETLTFEKWFEAQDENIKGLLDGHTKGLKSALTSERETRKELEKQIRELVGKAEKGSELEKQLTELSSQIEHSERRAAFYEKASREGVSNMKALFVLASAEGKFNAKGEADFAALKVEYPEFFTKLIPDGNAGEGSDAQPVQSSMNDIIRRAAGAKHTN